MSTFFNTPLCKCKLNYGMSLLFFITGNIFIYFLILKNVFNINWGPNEINIRVIFWFFAEAIIIILSRCLCTLDNRSEIISDDEPLLV